MCLIALLCSPSKVLRADGFPVLTGYLTGKAAGPASAVRLEIDGRPVQLSPETQFSCDAMVLSFQVNNGVPVYPAGVELAVYGRWDKKLGAYRADSLCVQKLPEKSVSGEGVLDAVAAEDAASGETSTVKPTIWSLDGYRMRLPAQAADREKAIHFPKAAPGTVNMPEPGDWVQYAAVRLSDGTLELRSALITPSLTGRTERRLSKWKPLRFEVPAGGHDGLFQVGHLMPKIVLPDDGAMIERVQRLGESVTPEWDRKMSDMDPRKHEFSFYPTKTVLYRDCASFPNGVILIPAQTVERLDDAEVAAVLAGCVATGEEDVIARYANKKEAGQAAMDVGFALLGPAELMGGYAYNAHIQKVIDEELARAGLAYLEAAGYPRSASATAWEKLSGKDGKVRLDREPSAEAELAYRYLAVSAP